MPYVRILVWNWQQQQKKKEKKEISIKKEKEWKIQIAFCCLWLPRFYMVMHIFQADGGSDRGHHQHAVQLWRWPRGTDAKHSKWNLSFTFCRACLFIVLIHSLSLLVCSESCKVSGKLTKPYTVSINHHFSIVSIFKSPQPTWWLSGAILMSHVVQKMSLGLGVKKSSFVGPHFWL